MQDGDRLFYYKLLLFNGQLQKTYEYVLSVFAQYSDICFYIKNSKMQHGIITQSPKEKPRNTRMCMIH